MQLHLRISALLATLLVSARSYMTAPPVASSFTPRMVAPQRSASSRSSGASITMKKGKPNVPIQQRGGYVQREKMMDQMGQMNPDSEGKPVFKLYVQTPRANMWYPCGSFVADERAQSLVDGWVANSMGMGGMIKGQIDRAVASTLFQGESKKAMTLNIVKQYPALKPSQRELRFGYKIEYEGLEESQGKQSIGILTEDMTQGPLDKIKNAFNFGE